LSTFIDLIIFYSQIFLCGKLRVAHLKDLNIAIFIDQEVTTNILVRLKLKVLICNTYKQYNITFKLISSRRLFLSDYKATSKWKSNVICIV